MQSFDTINAFLATRPTTNVNVSKFPKTGMWRVEFIMHNRTGMYTLRFGFSGYTPGEFKFYIKSKRLIVPGITEAYVDGDTFSILSIAAGSEERAQSICYDMADKYRDDKLLVLPRSHSHFVRDLSGELGEVIDGALAGDGCITVPSTKSGMFLYQLGEKQLGHMEEMVSVLQKYGFDGTIKRYSGSSELTGKTHSFLSITWALRCLKKHRERWYSPEGMKKLPTDVCNTPTFWRWFYAGDGCFERAGAFSGHVTLCANDFSTEEVERLREMLLVHGIESKKWAMRNQGTTEKPQWLIWIFARNARKFLKMTSPAIKGLEYKWAIPDIPIYNCPTCKKDFSPYRADMIYCTPKCREGRDRSLSKK